MRTAIVAALWTVAWAQLSVPPSHVQYQAVDKAVAHYSRREVCLLDSLDACLQQCKSVTADSLRGDCTAAHWSELDFFCELFIGAIFEPRESDSPDVPFNAYPNWRQAVESEKHRPGAVVLDKMTVKKGFFLDTVQGRSRTECLSACYHTCPRGTLGGCCTEFTYNPTNQECTLYTGVKEFEEHDNMQVAVRSENALHNIDLLRWLAFNKFCDIGQLVEQVSLPECRYAMTQYAASAGTSYGFDDNKCIAKKAECVNGGLFYAHDGRVSDFTVDRDIFKAGRYFTYYPHLCMHTASEVAAFAFEVDAADPSICAGKCMSAHGCVGFEWYGDDEQCYHLSSFQWTGDYPGAELHEKCITGIYQRVFGPFAGPLNGWIDPTASYTYPAQSTAECASQCLQDRDCRAFDFHTEQQRCRLHPLVNIVPFTDTSGDRIFLLDGDRDTFTLAGWIPYVGTSPSTDNIITRLEFPSHNLLECSLACGDGCVAFTMDSDARSTGDDYQVTHECILFSDVTAPVFVGRRARPVLYIRDDTPEAVDGALPHLCGQEIDVDGVRWSLEHDDCAAHMPDLSELVALEEVRLVDTMLTAPLSGDRLPASLRVLMALDNVHLTGTVPDVSHTALVHLRLEGNALMGEVYASLFPSSLVRLSLQHQHLSGLMPVFAPSSFPVLSSVLLANNEWDCGQEAPVVGPGVTHDFDFKPCVVSVCGVDYNPRTTFNIDLSGYGCDELLPDFSPFVHLARLDLSHNDFRGVLTVARLPASLEYLDASHNSLSIGADFPSSSSMPQLVTADLNGLTWLCPLPLDAPPSAVDCVTYLSAAQLPFYASDTTAIELTEYTLYGPLPDLRDFHQLESVRLHEPDTNVGFSGPVSADYFPSGLRVISIRNGHLDGTIPSFAAFPLLTTLVLRGHAMTGGVSASLLPPALRVLDLSRNQLQGPFPDLSSFSDLRRVKLQGNALSGAVLASSLSASLVVLKLRSNAFSGPVPVLNECSDLTKVLLADNHWNCPVADYSWVDVNDWSEASDGCKLD